MFNLNNVNTIEILTARYVFLYITITIKLKLRIGDDLFKDTILMYIIINWYICLFSAPLY